MRLSKLSLSWNKLQKIAVLESEIWEVWGFFFHACLKKLHYQLEETATNADLTATCTNQSRCNKGWFIATSRGCPILVATPFKGSATEAEPT